MPQGADIVSMQSNVKDYMPSMPVSLDGLREVTRLRPLGPNIVAGGVATLAPAGFVIDGYNSMTPGGVKCRYILLQNQSQSAVKYTFNATSGSAAYHGVLAACSSAASDGLGGNRFIDIQKFGINQISLWSAAAISVSVEGYTDVI